MAISPKDNQGPITLKTVRKAISCRFTPLVIILLFILLIGLITLASNIPLATAVSSHTTSNNVVSLVVANSKAWKPFSYIDNKGEPRGLLIDLWKEFAEVNQIEIEFLLTDWQESIDNVR
ncbi:transporter substrate-binding domain-containing protein [Shewanella halifaxensis]|uniref:transporter substrate-binding domain-containing protein n=1 Tax=Shewanella halifaxensis TaxID=271098 RepID=UPI000674414B